MSDAPAVPDGHREWGLGDAFGWLVAAQFGSLLFGGLVVVTLHGTEALDTLPITTLFLAQIALWLAYGLGPIIATTRRGQGPLRDLGTRIVASDLVWPALLGVALQVVIIPVLYWPFLRLFDDVDPGEDARRLVDSADGVVDHALLAIIVVVMAPLVEELFFRGLFLRALQRVLSPWPAILLSAVIFAAVHLQLVQFGGLAVFGLVAAVLTVRTGRLGPAWSLHFGFNATTLVILYAF